MLGDQLLYALFQYKELIKQLLNPPVQVWRLNVLLPTCARSTLSLQPAWGRESAAGGVLGSETVSEWSSNHHSNRIFGAVDSVTACTPCLFYSCGSERVQNFTEWIFFLHSHMKVWGFRLVGCFWDRVSLCRPFWPRTCYLDYPRIHWEHPAACVQD